MLIETAMIELIMEVDLKGLVYLTLQQLTEAVWSEKNRKGTGNDDINIELLK